MTDNILKTLGIADDLPSASRKEPAGPSINRCRYCRSAMDVDAWVCPTCKREKPSLAEFNRSEDPASRKWHPGVAAVLSLIIPGAGQIYKGSFGTGIVWFLLTGLFLFAPPLLYPFYAIASAYFAYQGDPYDE